MYIKIFNVLISALILFRTGTDGFENNNDLKRNVKGGDRSTNIKSPLKRLPTSNRNRIWEGMTVPYVLDPNFDENETRVILGALLDISSKTCITFKPKWSSETKYVNFIKGQSCLAKKVMPGQDERQLTLASQCLKHYGLLGLLLGLLGFPVPEIQEFINYRTQSGKGSQLLLLRKAMPSLAKLCSV